MKTKITLIAAGALLLLSGAAANAQTCSNDLNSFVSYKNVGATGSYQLQNGFEEKAAQTYYYSGPGRISGVRLYGSYPGGGMLSGVNLNIGVFTVDASGRPLSQLASRNDTWWSFPDNGTGYIDVTFPGGVAVSGNFAVTVEIVNAFPWGNAFNLKYTGNGEGGGQDLASLAGTSTGGNWASAKTSFNKDGDFYIVPNMAHINSPAFTTTSSCYGINEAISFSNTSHMSKDSMFNKIAFPNYVGSNHFYTWNFGDGSPVSNLMNPTHAYAAGGVYTVTLTTKIEGWAGTCTRTYTKSLSVGLAVNSSAVSQVSCYNGTNGSFVASGQFGAPAYQYNINGGSWQSGQNFTNLAAGTYTLAVKDTKGCTNTSLVTITQPAGIVINSISTTNASCGSATGAFTSSVTGGVAPLSYKVDFGSYVPGGNFSNLSAGPHLFTVKDANGCTTTTLVIINSQAGPMMLPPNVTNVSCYGGNDGGITLASFGGTGAIQYSINGGLSFQASPVFTNVSAGTYSCVVKDNAGCTNHTQVVVSQGPSLSLSLSSVPVKCYGGNDGQIMASSTGGTGIRNYSLNGTTYQSASTFSGLSAGTYTVFVKDVTGCVKTQTIAVTSPAALVTTLTSTAAACYGEQNGSVAAVTTGGSGGYTYSMDGTDFYDQGAFDNLPAGTYSVVVKDLNNCSKTSTISVSQPAAITATVNTTAATCGSNNGGIQAIAAGGSGSGYQYSLDGTNFSGSGVFTSLASGTRFVVIKDGVGCSTIVSGVIISAGGPTITASGSQNVSCFGGNDGSITVSTVVGGTGVLQYSKDGVSFQTSNVLTGLSAGVYNVQVKDANGCISSVSKTITQPNAFLIAPSTSSVSCYGGATGSATIAASGGAGFLVYSINGGLNYQSGSVFTNLTAGDYTVIVKDAANCLGTAAYSIVQPSMINLTVGSIDATCFGSNNGQINVTATGGTSPYLYNINGSAYSSVNSFSNLVGNTIYTTNVKDANGCIVSHLEFISEPTQVAITASRNNVSCAGGNNGSINLNVSGGVSPYYYQWSNGVTTPSNTNLVAGTYSVTVSDYHGCSSQLNYTVTQPLLPLIVNGTVVNSTGSGLNGSIDVTATGGTAPYAYSWSNGKTTEDLSGLNAGSYVVTIIDAQGCSTSNTFTVSGVTGIESLQVNDGVVKVYPNPATDFVVIEASGAEILKIELVNLLGQTILVNEIGDLSARVNTSDISNGTYFVKIYFHHNTVTKKINISK